MSKKTQQAPAPTIPHTLTVLTADGRKATLELSQKGRRFTVVGFLVHDNPDLSMGFRPKGEGIENLDENSDAMDVFNISTKIKVNGYITLDTSEMIAPSVEELIAALKKVKITPFNHEDI